MTDYTPPKLISRVSLIGGEEEHTLLSEHCSFDPGVHVSRDELPNKSKAARTSLLGCSGLCRVSTGLGHTVPYSDPVISDRTTIVKMGGQSMVRLCLAIGMSSRLELPRGKTRR